MPAGSGFSPIEAHLREKRVLVVDDERDLGELVAQVLAGAGLAHVETARSGEEALGRAVACADDAARAFQLFVLDVMMPGMDGFELLSLLRAQSAYRSCPAIFLTARDEPADRVSGLVLGADDYIAKPFLPQELVLRVGAVLRRCYGRESPALTLDAATVDLATAEVTRADGTRARLTAKEHEIVSVLARNAGRIVTIDEICEACWGSTFAYENSLMAHIRRLREKIEADPSHPRSLVTVRGLGYKLEVRR